MVSKNVFINMYVDEKATEIDKATGVGMDRIKEIFNILFNDPQGGRETIVETFFKHLEAGLFTDKDLSMFLLAGFSLSVIGGYSS